MRPAPDNTAPAAASQPSAGRRLRYGLEHRMVRFIVWLLSKLPLCIVRVLASALGTLAWMVDSRGRRTGMENLRVAFGDGMSAARRRRVLRTAYRIFSRTFLDLFWSSRISREKWDRYFILQADTQAAHDVLDSGHYIAVTAHFGGYELLPIAEALRSRGSMIVAQNFKNPPLTEIFKKLRSAGGRHMTIPSEGAMLRLFKHLKRGGSAAAVVDLNVKPERSATVIRSFGMLASVSVLHCVLAERTETPVLPCVALRAKDGRWLLRFFDPLIPAAGADHQQFAQQCWEIFEPVIRAHPDHWMWMYKHWRYLPPDVSPKAYPAYATRHVEFDMLLRSLQASAPSVLSSG